MKKIIITGCNGQLGRALNKELENKPEYELVNTDVAELDITDIDKVLELAKEVSDDALTAAVTDAGYEVKEIK